MLPHPPCTAAACQDPASNLPTGIFCGAYNGLFSPSCQLQAVVGYLLILRGLPRKSHCAIIQRRWLNLQGRDIAHSPEPCRLGEERNSSPPQRNAHAGRSRCTSSLSRGNQPLLGVRMVPPVFTLEILSPLFFHFNPQASAPQLYSTCPQAPCGGVLMKAQRAWIEHLHYYYLNMT